MVSSVVPNPLLFALLKGHPDLMDAHNLKEEMNRLPLMRLDSGHWDCDLQLQSPGQNYTKLVMFLCPKITNTLTARC